MTIRCSRCGSAKFFFTLPGPETNKTASHHGAYCGGCGKPLTAQDIKPPVAAVRQRPTAE